MITLYRPVLIESAEQAEALPIGTIAVDKPDSAPPVGACIKGSDGGWYETGDPTPWEGEQMVGDTALVPIEVEVEYIRESGGRRREKTLYVTPWVSSGPDSAAAEAQALADCGDEA